MLKKIAIVMLMMIIEVSFPMRTMQGIPIAQKASVPKPQDKLALREDGVKELLPTRAAK